MCRAKANDRSAAGGLKAYWGARGARFIERSRIRSEPDPARRRHSALTQEELNESVKRSGILLPITVCYVPAEDIYRVVVGHRRFVAACAAGLTEIPCWLRALLRQIARKLRGPELHPYDLADAVARLKDANDYTQRDIARLIRKSEAQVSKVLALLELVPAVQKIAREDRTGHITARLLYALSRLPAKEQLDIVRRAQEGGISAIDLERIAGGPTARLRVAKHSRTVVFQRWFRISRGVVAIRLHGKEVTPEKILAAIDEVRRQLQSRSGDHSPL